MDEETLSLDPPKNLRRATGALLLAAGASLLLTAARLSPRLRARRAEPAGLSDLRDSVADGQPGSKPYVLAALRRLSADDPVGAVALSAQALVVDRTDDAALATLRLAEKQLALRGAAPEPRRSFWQLVFSPIMTTLLLLAAALQIILFWTRRREAKRAGKTANGRDRSTFVEGVVALPQGYRRVRTLGEGGMGVVFEAEDSKLGRKVAIKKMREEIKRDRKERERFLQEARLVAALHHPAIVDIHTIVEDEENIYLVFEYIAGKTVESILSERRCLPLQETKGILRRVCEALDFAHRQGVVHRDLKPSNIMVSDDGEVKVMDFGVARRAKDSLRRLTTQTIAGTPLYMAPEAEDGVVRKESDVYALGACLYEMVTGEGVFPSPTTRASKMCRRYIPPSRQREGLPPSLDSIVDWALQPDPDRRIPTPREFSQRLEEVL